MGSKREAGDLLRGYGRHDDGYADGKSDAESNESVHAGTDSNANTKSDNECPKYYAESIRAYSKHS